MPSSTDTTLTGKQLQMTQLAIQGWLQTGGSFLLYPFDKLIQQGFSGEKPVSYGTLKEKPWNGSAYVTKINAFRLPLLYTMVFGFSDELKAAGFGSMQSRMIGGAGAAFIDVVCMSRFSVVTAMLQMKSESDPTKAWNSIPIERRAPATRAAIKWGSARAMTYWSAFPPLFEYYQNHMPMLLASMLGGATSSLLMFPVDKIMRNKIPNPDFAIAKEIKEGYQRNGFFGSAAKLGKEVFVSSFIRSPLASFIFGLTFAPSKIIVDEISKSFNKPHA